MPERCRDLVEGRGSLFRGPRGAAALVRRALGLHCALWGGGHGRAHLGRGPPPPTQPILHSMAGKGMSPACHTGAVDVQTAAGHDRGVRCAQEQGRAGPRDTWASELRLGWGADEFADSCSNVSLLVWETFNCFDFWRENRLVNVGWCYSHLTCGAYSFSISGAPSELPSLLHVSHCRVFMVVRVEDSRGKLLYVGKIH